MTKKLALLISIVVIVALLIFVPALRAPAGLAMALLYNLFALLIIASFAALFGWYVFGILLPGLIRYRRLRQIRYYREINRRRRQDDEDV